MDSMVDLDPGGTAVIRIRGRLDFLSAAGARQRFSDVIEGGHRRLVVDLDGLEFLDSSGLGALIGGLKAARQTGGDLRLARAPEQAKVILSLTSLDRVFRSYGTVEEALADY